MSFPAVGSYSAGKFALEGWSEALAGEVAPFGVRVLIVEPSRLRTAFNAAGVLRTAQRSADYDASTGAVRANMAEADGVQEGDLARAARVIRDVLDAPDAPLRLPLGAEAVRNLTRVYRRALDDVEKWASVSESADFPGMPPAVRRSTPDESQGRRWGPNGESHYPNYGISITGNPLIGAGIRCTTPTHHNDSYVVPARTGRPADHLADLRSS